MIRLNEYIDIQLHPEEYIMERDAKGRTLWQRIKNWFNKLFSSNDDYDFDRYNPIWNRDYYDYDKKGSSTSKEGEASKTKQEYEEYLKKNFNKKYLKFLPITQDEGEKIIIPEGLSKDKLETEGFYKFFKGGLATNRWESIHKYACITYDHKNKAKDTAVLYCFHLKRKDDSILVLRQFQPLDVFKPYISDKEIIDMLIDFIKKSKDYQSAKSIVYYEKWDKDNYNSLLKDCGFKEEYDEQKYDSYAKKSI